MQHAACFTVVVEDGALGRHLVAAKALKAGQIAVQQLPYAAVLYDDQVPLRCDYCFREAPSGSLLRCSRSKHARYCSREHQVAAWEAGYKTECTALVAFQPRVPPPTVRMAARALWRMHRSQLQRQGGKGTGKQHPEDEHCSWEAVQALLPHWASLTDERKTLFAQMAVVTLEFASAGLSASKPLAPSMPPPSASPTSAASASATASASADFPPQHAFYPGLPGVQEVALLLARFSCNNHTICDEELRPIGVGLYPLGALLNHSCRPNCMQGFGANGRIEFRALAKIQPGEPLTISYVELAATRQERRIELAETYFFDIDAAEGPAVPGAANGGGFPGARSLGYAGLASVAEEGAAAATERADEMECEGLQSAEGAEQAAGAAEGTAGVGAGAGDGRAGGEGAGAAGGGGGRSAFPSPELPPGCSRRLKPTAAAEIDFTVPIGALGSLASSIAPSAVDLNLGKGREEAEEGKKVGVSRLAQLLALEEARDRGGVGGEAAEGGKVAEGGGGGGGGGRGAEEEGLPASLRVYWGRGADPSAAPWPCDEADALLTQLVVLAPLTASSSSASPAAAATTDAAEFGLVALDQQEEGHEGGDAEEEEQLREQARRSGVSEAVGRRVGLESVLYALPGGLQVHLVQVPEPAGAAGSVGDEDDAMMEDDDEEEEEGLRGRCGAARGGSATSSSAPDCRYGGSGVGALPREAWASEAAAAALSGRGGRGGGKGGVGRRVAEVECWGAWATEVVGSAMERLQGSRGGGGGAAEEAGAGGVAAASGAEAGSGLRVGLAALARRVAAAAHFQDAAEALQRQGRHSEAVRVLQRALEQLDPEGASTTTSSSAAVTTTTSSAAAPTPAPADFSPSSSLPVSSTAGPTAQIAAPAVLQLSPGLGRRHLLRARINAALLKAAIDEGSSWQVALRAARELLPVYRLVYPPVWPNLGLALATLAKLELLLDLPRATLKHAREALRILEVTHQRGGGSGVAGGQRGPAGLLCQVEETMREAQHCLLGLAWPGPMQQG